MIYCKKNIVLLLEKEHFQSFYGLEILEIHFLLCEKFVHCYLCRSSLRPKPYLLEVPEDKEQYGEPFDYGHSTGRTRSARYEGEVTRAPDEGRVLLNRRGGLLERDR